MLANVCLILFLRAKGLEVKLAVVNRLRDLEAQQHIHREEHMDILLGILQHLEEEFGSGYLIYFLMRPYNDALVGVDHHRLAEALLGKHTGLLWLQAFFH